jgi:hypothetical protein
LDSGLGATALPESAHIISTDNRALTSSPSFLFLNFFATPRHCQRSILQEIVCWVSPRASPQSRIGAEPVFLISGWVSAWVCTAEETRTPRSFGGMTTPSTETRLSGGISMTGFHLRRESKRGLGESDWIVALFLFRGWGQAQRRGPRGATRKVSLNFVRSSAGTATALTKRFAHRFRWE